MSKSSIQIDNTKAMIWGAVIIFLQMGTFYIIWMNPFVNDPAVKPYEYFGGLDNWMRLRTVYLVVMLAILIKVFLMFYTNIPGDGWKKGMNYGVIISLISVLPSAFNKWTLIVYPNELILLQLINGTIGTIIFGILISVIYHKFGVIIDKSKIQLIES